MKSAPLKSLPSLFNQIPVAPLTAVPDVEIRGIALDSRRVQPGDLFVALEGGQLDGHQFIGDALQHGAAAAVGTTVLGADLPYVRVEDGRLALAYLSAAFFDFPARRLTVIAVTGTDGKTTTCSLLLEILQAAGIAAGMVSTVYAQIGSNRVDTGFHVTTPEAPDVQAYLASMVSAGLTHAVLEATSHGLAQHRLTGCEFDIGVMTNITHEHLDYHGSFESYREAKSRLFEMLGTKHPKPDQVNSLAVLNRDDPSYEFLASRTPVKHVAYSLQNQTDLWSEGVSSAPRGLSFIARGRDFYIPIHTQLVGDFNISNCLAAAATAYFGLGIDSTAIQAGIARLSEVPGRMERVDLGQEYTALVDFAHTPNALRAALQSARQISTGKVWAVFGSAGLRDRAKRRLMPQASAQLADVTILTAEDPRTENLAEILEEMADGARAAGGVEGATFLRIPDRREAIRFAVHHALPGDVVILCGKGHEQSMCFGNIEVPWDDRTALQAALSERLGIPGPTMPTLPIDS